MSEAVIRALTVPTGPRPVPSPDDARRVTDPLTDRDFQLALWMLYELHYRGFDGIDPDLEWDPLLIAARRPMEAALEAAVRELAAVDDEPTTAKEVATALTRMTNGCGAGELATFLGRHATKTQFREYLAERAVYHLHESDPQSFVLPRIDGPAKVALAELQYDEYGSGRPDRIHAGLYAKALTSLGIPTDLLTHVDRAEATTLASVNTMSLFALNRRLRGAALGHLAAFEATSSLPCAAIAEGARRLGLPPEVADYYDEHVEADAVHEQLAIRDICGALVENEPALGADVVLGAAACLAVDGLAADVLLDRWRDLRSAAS
ncbi:iron-containing redox enzyme family protein [Nocardioides sp. TF02-7]|uniref:iron-containing redox enzyme family protein n=1 Tax=Nocardioides sp. TF02-7 TaxID=2917724 RepID=UPI001F066626|nr:iron-containing redox enzyme family protein [Nocardioides sp. TF02-7]UMG93665.1 iron-containing redox enzyme family protein [Nocardioides sp. TF02-7]